MLIKEKTRKIRIIFVSHASRLEGAEKSMLQIVEKLSQQHKISPLVIIPKSGPLETVLVNKNIPYIRAHRYPWWVDTTTMRQLLLGPLKYIWNIFSWYLIKSPIKSFNPDIVYINTLVAPFGSIIAKDLNVPKVWHAREFIPKWLESDYDFGRRWSLNKVAESAAVISCSCAVMHDISDYIPKNKQHVIYNGISLSQFNYNKIEKKILNRTSRRKRTIRLLIVGSINKNKGQATAIKALSELRNRGINATLTLIGEIKKNKNYDLTLKQLSKKLDIDAQLSYKGWQKNTKIFFEAADITLVCSKGEPFGRTIIESMALGTPVICSNTGGAPEIIEKVDTGLLFKEGDSKNLANIIEQLMKDTAWYETIVKKGRRIVEDNFEENIYVKKIYETLRNIQDNTNI